VTAFALTEPQRAFAGEVRVIAAEQLRPIAEAGPPGPIGAAGAGWGAWVPGPIERGFLTSPKRAGLTWSEPEVLASRS
jgi:hypothetical protein